MQKDEPPEITYCVVNQNGMLHLQPLSPSQPMPEESELDAKFTELLVSQVNPPTLNLLVFLMDDPILMLQKKLTFQKCKLSDL